MSIINYFLARSPLDPPLIRGAKSLDSPLIREAKSLDSPLIKDEKTSRSLLTETKVEDCGDKPQIKTLKETKMTKINSKSTKAEILAAFQELKKENASLESQIKKGNTQGQVTKSATTTTKAKESKTVKATGQYNMNQIITNLQNLHYGFGSATSNLSEQLIAEATSLNKLQESVREELEQLQELHKLESVAEDTLDNLIEDYEQESKTFAEQFEERMETLSQEIQGLKQGWQKDRENHSREVAERNENYQKTNQRHGEEYQYDLERTRNLSEEEYEEDKKNRYKELKEAKQEQEKQWKEREETISKQEKEYAEAKEKVEAFKQQLEDKKKQGQEKGRSIGYYQAKIKSDLRKKEVEGETRNYELQIQSLEDTIKNQEARIQALSKQLDASLKQVQDLAVKAIEGTSNRNSYEAMKEIAMEQAKNPQKGK